MRLPFRKIFMAIIGGLLITYLAKERLTLLLFSGKGFEGRSFSFQLLLLAAYALFFSIIVYLCLTPVQKLFRRYRQSITGFIVGFNKNIILYFVVILLLIYPIKFIFNYLSFPYMIEYRETASLYAAYDFSSGVNLYSVQNYPGHMYLYSPLYPMVLAPFIKLVANPLYIARGMTFFFLILFLVLSYIIFRKRNASLISSLIGVLILLNSFCYIWSIDGSRADTLGIFFAILGFYILLNEKPGPFAIILSAVVCILSFYIKQYMLFSSLVIAVYLFLFNTKKNAYLFVSVSAILGLGSFLVLRYFYPLLYEYMILHYINTVSDYVEYMKQQYLFFLQYFWLLCFVYLYNVHKKISAFGLNRIKEIHLLWKNPQEPLIQGVYLDLFDVNIIISLLLLTFSMGRHIGNWYIYYGELLLPALLYAVIPMLDSLFKNKHHRQMIQLLILVLCVLPFSSIYATDFSLLREQYTTLSQYVDKCTHIYDDNALVSLLKLEHGMVPLYNNGQVEYRQTITSDHASIFNKLSLVPVEELKQQMLNRDESIQNSLKNKEFDCIFTDNEKAPENYQQTAKINYLGAQLFLFTPISH